MNYFPQYFCTSITWILVKDIPGFPGNRSFLPVSPCYSLHHYCHVEGSCKPVSKLTLLCVNRKQNGTPCIVTKPCRDMMTRFGCPFYSLSHQLLYFMIGGMVSSSIQQFDEFGCCSCPRADLLFVSQASACFFLTWWTYEVKWSEGLLWNVIKSTCEHLGDGKQQQTTGHYSPKIT